MKRRRLRRIFPNWAPNQPTCPGCGSDVVRRGEFCRPACVLVFDSKTRRR